MSAECKRKKSLAACSRSVTVPYSTVVLAEAGAGQSRVRTCTLYTYTYHLTVATAYLLPRRTALLIAEVAAAIRIDAGGNNSEQCHGT